MKRVIRASLEIPRPPLASCPHCDNYKYAAALEIFAKVLNAIENNKAFELSYIPELYDGTDGIDKHALLFREKDSHTETKLL